MKNYNKNSILNKKTFLNDLSSRNAEISGIKSNIDLDRYWLGKGDLALEVVLASSRSIPTASNVKDIWKKWQANRAAPVLLIVVYKAGNKEITTICGATDQNLAISDKIPIDQAERLARSSLSEINRNQAILLIQNALPELKASLPGIINRGLFSTNDLARGVPTRDDWVKAVKLSLPLLDKKGEDLINLLGFNIETLTTSTSILRSSGTKQAVAIFLQDHEMPEVLSSRFNNHSPVNYALTMADKEGLPYVIMTKGSQIRIYCTDASKGVGRKGRTETFCELNLSLVSKEFAGLLVLIFSAKALKEGGSLEELLDNSYRFASEIGNRLRERIYGEAIPQLATALAKKQSSVSNKPTSKQLNLYYEQSMLILFRILFVAYAEDRDLLPYRTNSEYKDHSLQYRAERLAENTLKSGNSKIDFATNQTTLWDEVNSLWKAVDKGNSEWGVPPYNGGLFSEDPKLRPTGFALSNVSLTNAEFAPALQAILVDEIENDVYGSVDFRSLSVREFGTIYEGLLESAIAFTETDLTTDKQGTYKPATDNQKVIVSAGSFYLTNRSGGRKSSGSYFTKKFAVDHLLEKALVPALQNHLRKVQEVLESGDEPTASEMFFDFRCADISMGSGHFLIAAIDRIEQEMANFLNYHTLVGVQRKLDFLNKSAIDNLTNSIGKEAQSVEIENSSLLRRQIARQCIYGVDLNSMAVELARLSVWIHTFVPGLPLSLLDRTLVQGDSLTGIGTLDELLDIFQVNPNDMFSNELKESLKLAAEPLRRLAKISEANLDEVQKAQKEYKLAIEESSIVKEMMNWGVDIRLGGSIRPAVLDMNKSNWSSEFNEEEFNKKKINCLHFPVAFPEVFLSEKGGFDCIIGNPPWEELTLEELSFWTIYLPGLKALKPKEQKEKIDELKSTRPDLIESFNKRKIQIEHDRKIIRSGSFDLGSGDTNLYKVFSWRFWQLLSINGYIGVVFPQQILTSQGMKNWRKEIFDNGEIYSSTSIINTNGWAFDDIHEQFLINLISLKKSFKAGQEIPFYGPYRSLSEFQNGLKNEPNKINLNQFKSWGELLSLPSLPTEKSVKVFLKMRNQPSLNSPKHNWIAKPVSELHQTNDLKKKNLMILDHNDRNDLLPVYDGKSFAPPEDILNPDTGNYFCWVDNKTIKDYLQQKRLNSYKRKKSVHFGLSEQIIKDPRTLYINRPRIIFQDITNSIDYKTIKAVLAPPNVALTGNSPYLFTNYSAKHEAFLLGVLLSTPFDWLARRYVSNHVNFFILNYLPVPLVNFNETIISEIQKLSGSLAAVDQRYSDWAKEVGVKVNSINSVDQKKEILSNIDALVSYLYGLNEDDIKVIFQTFHHSWDYSEKLNKVLNYFRSI